MQQPFSISDRGGELMKREKACVDARRNRITEILRDRPQVRVDELADLLEVSVITIRRDCLLYTSRCV